MYEPSSPVAWKCGVRWTLALKIMRSRPSKTKRCLHDECSEPLKSQVRNLWPARWPQVFGFTDASVDQHLFEHIEIVRGQLTVAAHLLQGDLVQVVSQVLTGLGAEPLGVHADRDPVEFELPQFPELVEDVCVDDDLLDFVEQFTRPRRRRRLSSAPEP